MAASSYYAFKLLDYPLQSACSLRCSQIHSSQFLDFKFKILVLVSLSVSICLVLGCEPAVAPSVHFGSFWK